jgi:hypothetical protein
MFLARNVAIASLISLSAGCSARRVVDDSLQPTDFGRFTFVAVLAGGQRLTGTIDVAPDTIIARTATVMCHVSPSQASAALLAYECEVPGVSGLSLLIDRRNPVRKSTWTAMTQVTKTRNICTEYRTWENGTRTCERSMPQEYFERVRTQGPIVVTR